MAAGHFQTRKNTSDTTVLANGGTPLDATWDTLVKDAGGSITYSNPYMTLDTGIYLITYSEVFKTPAESTDSTNRLEIQGEIHVNGTGVVGGYGQEYIRQDSGNFEGAVSGSMFLEVTSDNTEIFTRFYRTDDSTEIVERLPGYGGISVLELDDTHNYGFASTSSSEATSGTTLRVLTLDTSDRMDGSFALASNQINVPSTGRYLITYSLDIVQGGTGRENAEGWLRKNGTNVVGTKSYSYMRGSDSTQDGALTWIGIVDATAGDDFDVAWSCPTNATVTASAGATLQIWELPSAADTFIAEATTGDFSGTSGFEWDTNPHIDTDSFTHTAGTTEVTLDQNDNCLVFGTFSRSDETVARAVPFVDIRLDGVIVDHTIAGAYERNTSNFGIAVNVAGLVNEIASGGTLSIGSTTMAVSGALTNTSGQFSVLSLESLWNYTYEFPVKINDFNTTEKFNWGNQNLIITGTTFGATQGTGKVEIWSDDTGTIKTVQSIDTWSETSIQIDTVQGSLPGDCILYLVVTDDNSVESNKLVIKEGMLSYGDSILELNPDHLWAFDGDYADTAGVNARIVDQGVVGTHPWVSNISDDATQAMQFDSIDDRREIVDSPYMNITIDSAERTIAGWIQLGGVQKSMGAIWKEGGGVQNIALISGLGNVLMAQAADSPGNAINAQAVAEIKLTPNRPYHFAIRYTLTEIPKELRFYLDGEEQPYDLTNGNPFGSGSFNSHSGDVTWGNSDNNLETGGTDIAYAGQEDCKYQYWCTWSDNSPNTGALNKVTEIRDVLFRRGAKPKYTIASDTEANMQADLDTQLENSEVEDWPLGIRVAGTSEGDNNVTLTANSLTFNDRTTLQVEWRGLGELTWIVSGTSAVDESKFIATKGGTISFEYPAIFTIANILSGSAVEIYDDEVVNLENHDTLLGDTQSSGTSFQYSHNGSNNDIIIKIFKAGYEEIVQSFALGSSNQTIYVSQEEDTN